MGKSFSNKFKRELGRIGTQVEAAVSHADHAIRYNKDRDDAADLVAQLEGQAAIISAILNRGLQNLEAGHPNLLKLQVIQAGAAKLVAEANTQKALVCDIHGSDTNTVAGIETLKSIAPQMPPLLAEAQTLEGPISLKEQIFRAENELAELLKKASLPDTSPTTTMPDSAPVAPPAVVVFDGPSQTPALSSSEDPSSTEQNLDDDEWVIEEECSRSRSASPIP